MPWKENSSRPWKLFSSPFPPVPTSSRIITWRQLHSPPKAHNPPSELPRGAVQICLPVCQDGVRNWERREEAEGPGCGARDSSAEMRFMTEASGVALLAWWRPVSNRPERPGVGREKDRRKNRWGRPQSTETCLPLDQSHQPSRLSTACTGPAQFGANRDWTRELSRACARPLS